MRMTSTRFPMILIATLALSACHGVSPLQQSGLQGPLKGASTGLMGGGTSIVEVGGVPGIIGFNGHRPFSSLILVPDQPTGGDGGTGGTPVVTPGGTGPVATVPSQMPTTAPTESPTTGTAPSTAPATSAPTTAPVTGTLPVDTPTTVPSVMPSATVPVPAEPPVATLPSATPASVAPTTAPSDMPSAAPATTAPSAVPSASPS
jgi:hypothetical protein